MRNVIALFALVCILLSGAYYAVARDQETTHPYDKTISTAQALGIAETTFRYQFDQLHKENVPYFFLELFGKDPKLISYQGSKTTYRLFGKDLNSSMIP